MKTLKISGITMLLALAAIVAGSCSENYDDAKYASIPPQISDMTFTNLSGDATIKAGDRIVATVVQGSYGRLLNGTTYTWSTSPDEGVSHSNSSMTVVYDNDARNPTDTLVFASAGTYTVTMTGKYKSSGNNQSINGTSTITDGTVTYATNGIMSYTVTVEKTLVVK